MASYASFADTDQAIVFGEPLGGLKYSIHTWRPPRLRVRTYERHSKELVFVVAAALLLLPESQIDAKRTFSRALLHEIQEGQTDSLSLTHTHTVGCAQDRAGAARFEFAASS